MACNNDDIAAWVVPYDYAGPKDLDAFHSTKDSR